MNSAAEAISPVLTGRVRPRDRLRLLAQAIEAEILPLLVQDRLGPGGQPDGETPQNARRRLQAWVAAAAPPPIDAVRRPHDPGLALRLAPVPQSVIDLAALALAEDDSAARQTVSDAVAAQGLECVCLDLLAPAARHLGELWSEDICSFADVTIGLMRLQSALLAVSVPEARSAADVSGRRRVLLAPAPGDQHTFGLTMVAGFLERGGWSVTQLTDGTPAVIEAALQGSWVGVFGVSAGNATKLAAVRRMLPKLRAVSRNPDLAIMVGGPLFAAHPGLAREIGADGTAADGVQAVRMAESLIAPRCSKPRVATG